jgi:sec-independent protein translocase protein TatC
MVCRRAALRARGCRKVPAADGSVDPATNSDLVGSFDPSVAVRTMDDRELPITEHLEELRQRLKRAVLSVVAMLAVTIYFQVEIFRLLQMPMNRALALHKAANPTSTFEVSMHFKDPVEPFFTYMKVAIYSAIFLSVPFILYQAWKFIAPGLYRHERRATAPFMISATLMFALGSVFCHQVALPFGYFALLSYAGDGVTPMIMMQEYTSTTLMLLLAFGLVFETPVVIIFLCRLGIITPQLLSKYRRHAIVVIAVVAAILTPPDAISMTIMGVPLYLLFELGILGARWLGKPEPREEPRSAATGTGGKKAGSTPAG